MESKHKNALIGALLAVVFVMAVGYAAFAQQLTINGTAEITSKWDVHFDPIVVGTDVTSTMTAVSTTSGESVVPITISKPAVAAPGTKGSIAYSQNNQVATISATLIQPGDTVTFKLKTSYKITILVIIGSLILYLIIKDIRLIRRKRRRRRRR